MMISRDAESEIFRDAESRALSAIASRDSRLKKTVEACNDRQACTRWAEGKNSPNGFHMPGTVPGQTEIGSTSE